MERIVATGGVCRPCVAGFTSATQLASTPCAGRVSLPTIKHEQRQRGRCTNVYGRCKTLRKHTPCATTGISSSPENVTQDQPDGFDITQVVALGGCAFNAYLDPDQSNLLEVTSDNGATITFIASPYTFPEMPVDGMVQIELKSASGLRDADWLGKSDTYTILTVGESRKQSSVIDGSLNPVWNESFSICVKDIGQDILHLQLKDKDLEMDDKLGFVEYPLKELKDGKLHDITLELGGRGTGTVTFQAKYIPFEDNKPEALSEIYSDESPDMENPDPSKTGVPRGWQELAQRAGRSAKDLCVPVCFIENKSTDTQAWVYQSDPILDRKEMVISFRGTEIGNLKDMVADVNLRYKQLDVSMTDTFQIVQRGSPEAGSDLKVHKGFYDAYNSVKACVADVVDSVTGGSSGWKIYVTGHSLGAALATLCAFDLATSEKVDADIQSFTYGSPRVGNEAFALAFDTVLSDSWRINNRRDLVAGLPALLGFHHVGKHVILSMDDLAFGGAAESSMEGSSFEEVVGDLKDEILEEVMEGLGDREIDFDLSGIREAAGDVLNPVVDTNMKLITSMVDGSGVKEHMEDMYLACIKGAVEKGRNGQ